MRKEDCNKDKRNLSKGNKRWIKTRKRLRNNLLRNLA
jgi:hypothetical protein